MKKKKWFAPTYSLFPMDEVLDAQVTILHAQVRKTPSVHGIDANGFIRPENHPEIEQKILLGEICETLFRVIKAKENPTIIESPSFNEQRWRLSVSEGDLSIEVESKPYWGFGLLTSCYSNTLTLRGPLHRRTELIFDLVASLPHKPWEVVWQKRFTQRVGNVDENAKAWHHHLDAAKQYFQESIETRIQALAEVKKLDKELDEEKSSAIEADIDYAKRALAEDNAPAMMRALARAEAGIIAIDPRAEFKIAALDEEDDEAEKEHVITVHDLTDVVVEYVHEEDDIPFVDLTTEEE